MNIATLEWIEAAMDHAEPFVLRLFVCGMTSRSERANRSTERMTGEKRAMAPARR